MIDTIKIAKVTRISPRYKMQCKHAGKENGPRVMRRPNYDEIFSR